MEHQNPEAQSETAPEAGTGFYIGDKVVHPVLGLAQITEIIWRDLGNLRTGFYKLRIAGSGISMDIPLPAVKMAGLRHAMSEAQIENIYNIFRAKTSNAFERSNWTARHAAMIKKIFHGSITDVAEATRDLIILKKKNLLNPGENSLLETACKKLTKEIAFVRGLNEHQVLASLCVALELQ